MDPQIKQRLKFDIMVYPCTGKVDGDSTFGTPIPLKGYEVPKYGVTVVRNGVSLVVKSIIYFDGADFDKIHKDDEIGSIFSGRVPVQAIMPYLAPTGPGYGLIEVYI